MAKPRILELSPEGPGPAHWALWLLRTRTDPGMRGGGVVTIGQELILTENSRLAEAASWRQFGGPAPHRP